MTLPLKSVANSFLQADFRDGFASISPMKIQKLVYLAHGWNLAINDEPLISEKFEAWPYGPVEEELYHIFKQYGNGPIRDYAKSWAGNEEKAFVVSDANSGFYDIFNRVMQKYGHFTALQLSALTHQPGTPWSETRANGWPEIPDDMIRDHFRELAAHGG
ncbi:hypothetical protein AAV99_07435 [Aurantiacibacter marinus]|uniref:Antitoxin SocA-like Panacea domain-containing protein n=2 Tax=Aurantiacibacter marinus TaxID=874156 RepID=A0A0H0XMK5_9SPHN|nr:hypothetical protein AAV99_07435 [Aurantiacibacter marinus]